MVKKKVVNNTKVKKVVNRKTEPNLKQAPTLNLKLDSDIAMDFATNVYKKFDKIIKAAVLFGSSTKESATAGSDIDIVLIIDDVSIRWDQELIAWYREELDKILQTHPYKKTLHVNTMKLSKWWEDLLKGDPLVINVIRYGESIIDLAGFFEPLKHLLIMGKIKATPEAIYSALQRAPMHLARSKMSELNAIEGLFWCMVDSAHAALIAANVPPASPEHIAIDLKETFVSSGKLKMDYVNWYRDLLFLHKKIAHGEIKDLKGIEIDAWQEKTENFLETMAKLVKELIE